MTSLILPNLYIGTADTAKFGLNQYDLIINCTKNIPNPLPLPDSMKCDNQDYSKNAKFFRIPVDDLPEDSDILLEYLPNITEKIHNSRLNNEKILIHCRQGVSRSCTVLAAYLLRYHNYSVEQVINFIKEKRPHAFFIEVRFKHVLEEFKQTIFNTISL